MLLKYLLVLMLCFIGHYHAAGQSSSYEDLQAAYVFNFAKYVTWSGNTHETFVIGIYAERNDEDIFHYLQAVLKGKMIQGRSIELRVIQNVEETENINILYVPRSGSKNMTKLVSAVGSRSILIVSEDDLIKRGAMISFVVEDDKLRFKMNQKSLKAAGLTASEGLLKLAIQQ
jgi:hypothetical protein